MSAEVLHSWNKALTLSEEYDLTADTALPLAVACSSLIVSEVENVPSTSINQTVVAPDAEDTATVPLAPDAVPLTLCPAVKA